MERIGDMNPRPPGGSIWQPLVWGGGLGFGFTSLGHGDDRVGVLVDDGDRGVWDLSQQVHQVTHAVVGHVPVPGETPGERGTRLVRSQFIFTFFTQRRLHPVLNVDWMSVNAPRQHP